MRVKGWCVDSGLCKIVLGGEEVYDGFLVGFCVCECTKISLYEDSY